MIDRLRAGELGRISPRGWRSLAGLAVMLAAIVQSAQVVRSFDGPLFVPAVASLTSIMSAAWFIQLGRAPIFRHMAGCASTALALISPGSGALIGVVSSIVISGLRFPSRQGAVAAITLDLRMARCDGVTATRRILQESPDIRVIIMTTYAERRVRLRCA